MGDSQSQTTRWSLVPRLQDPEDVEAWNWFVDVYAGPVRRQAQLILGRRHPDVDDVWQEVVIQVKKRVEERGIERSGGRFRGLVNIIARRAAMKIRAKNGPAANGGDEALAGVAGKVVGGRAVTVDDIAELDRQWELSVKASMVMKAIQIVRDEVAADDWRCFEKTRIVSTHDEEGNEYFEIAERPIQGTVAAVAKELKCSEAQVYRVTWEMKKRISEVFKGLSSDE